MGISMSCAIAAALLSTAPASAPQAQGALSLERLFAPTTDGSGVGAAVQIRGGPPWWVQTLAPTDGGRLMRQFGKQLFVIHPEAGTITRITGSWGLPQVYDFGASSAPQDILDPSPAAQYAPLAFVTRRNNPQLHRINLLTGQGTDVLDLSPVGGGDPIALGTMERDGNHLFVQVRVFEGQEAVPGGDSGVLAVVDLATLSLVDVDTTQPGIQGVALQGAPPHLKMQILEETRTLFVSTTDGLLDSRGGIEMVNLDSLSSVGYALSEQQIADLGGFVMTSPHGGFFVFHTDWATSTHLKRFTILGGPDPGPEMIVLLGDSVERIAYDPKFKRIFLPSGHSGGTPGIYVFDAITKLPVGLGPIDTGMKPHDVLVAQ